MIFKKNNNKLWKNDLYMPEKYKIRNFHHQIDYET